MAPTRAVCVNLRALLGVEKFETRLMAERGRELIGFVQNRKAFGIVAVTGSGKSASIKNIAEQEFGVAKQLEYDIVTREHEATDKTWRSNVIVITPGIALIWAKDRFIKKKDLVIFDEIHQTSEHLELTLALVLRIGCRIIWMSATVDHGFFAEYLKSNQVIVFNKVDEAKKAKVVIIPPENEDAYLYCKIEQTIREKRGMVMFLPTRRETEEYAQATKRMFLGKIKVVFYHGGEPADKLDPFLNKGIANKNRPFIIFMTNAGQSGLNIEGLSIIGIRDQCYTEELMGRTIVKFKTFLETNDILQMGGRVNGRVADGEIFISTRREIDFHKLRPEKVKFVLGHNLERLALVCGRLGIDCTELSLPEPVDKQKYAEVVKKLIRRGILDSSGISLTEYGWKVERIPCSVEWAEMIVNSPPEILNTVIVCSASSGLFRILKPGGEAEYDLSEFIVPGSDHLTLYNIVAHAINNFAEIVDDKGYTEYRFKEKEFYGWAEEKGINVKEIEEIALALKSIRHNLGMPIPKKLPEMDKNIHSKFVELLDRVRSLDIVRGEQDIDGNEVWPERISMCEAGGIVIGTVSAWLDRDNIIRRAIEGTAIV